MNGKAENFFRIFGKKIDGLFEEVENSDFVKKLEIKDRLKELEKDKQSLEKSFSNFREENKQTIDDISNSLEESFQDIKKSFSNFRKSTK